MKMTLEFNLPEENDEANKALNVNKLYIAIYAYSQKLRSIIKYSDDAVEADKAEWARKLLYEELAALTEIYEV